jgi:uncharacterized protein
MVFAISDFKYIDIHTHFFPPNLFKAIWNYFEIPGDDGNPRGWEIHYKLGNEQLVSLLKELNILHYTTLNYAHKEGISEGLNEWTYNFTMKHKDAIGFGTCFPSDKNKIDYITKAFDEFQLKGLKLQLLVQDFYPFDERMFEVYKLVIDYGKWITMHCGTAPYSNEFVGFKNFVKMIEKFPDIKIIIAHLGAYEYEKFFKLLDRYDNVFLDTAMVFIPLDLFKKWKFNLKHPEKELIVSYQDRILYGSDFPNIPYEYESSIQGLLDLDLDRKVYEKIFYQNAKKTFKLN